MGFITENLDAADSPATGLARRIARLDWARIEAELDAGGVGLTGPLLTPAECAALSGLYSEPQHFRSRVIMARHGFGRGEYQYFDHPLPPLIATLRRHAYSRLAPLANRWNAAMGLANEYPAEHPAFLQECHAAGQSRPTPLLLRYQAGDFNCLHQDLYGEVYFPLQLVVLLSHPGRDFCGGELTLVEQRPRMQSRVQVAPLAQGEAAIFAVRQRPVRGSRGVYRVQMRHGVSVVRRGERFTAGVIFHDAK